MKFINNKPTGFKQRLKSFIENYFPTFYESYLWKVSKANDKYFKKVINADIKFIKNMDHLPIFMQIEIETINRCNSDCSFCPINIHDDDRSFGLMTEELFFSIIDQLAILKYKGEISFHSNNEPLMDKRIIKFIKYAKKQCPEAYLLMYTNGILLTIDKFKELTQYLDHLRIDNYNDDYELNPAVAEILKYVNDSGQPFENVQIDVLKKIFKRNTRGGQASNRKNLMSLDAPCLFPYTQFVIRPDGKISLCCIDAKGVYSLGDLNKQTILDVWYGKKFQRIRKKLSISRSKIKVCENCDSYAALPKAIIPHVEKSTFDRSKFVLIKQEPVIHVNSNIKRISSHFEQNIEPWAARVYDDHPEPWYEYNSFRLRENYALDMVKEEPKGSAIDLGCGVGHATIMLRQMGFQRVVGVDISQSMLAEARQLLEINQLSGQVELYHSDVQDLRMIDSRSIDACLALGVIEYQDEDAPLLSEVNRILKTSGVAVIQVRNYNCIYLRTLELYQTRSHRKQLTSIDHREHRPIEFRDDMSRYGFEVEHECFSHFYALYPFNLLPKINRYIKPFDSFFSKYFELLSPYQLSKYLASMYIISIRKQYDL